MNSISTNTIFVGFIVLDLLVCQIHLLTTLYDPAIPSQLTVAVTSIQVLFTNYYAWTAIRTPLFWISASLRILFVVECIVRVFLHIRGLDWYIILDCVVSIACLVCKFTVNSRDNFGANYLVLLRLGRAWLLMDQFYTQVEDEADKRLSTTERHCNDMLRHSEMQMQRLVQKLETAESKLKVMMG